MQKEYGVRKVRREKVCYGLSAFAISGAKSRDYQFCTYDVQEKPNNIERREKTRRILQENMAVMFS